MEVFSVSFQGREFNSLINNGMQLTTGWLDDCRRSQQLIIQFSPPPFPVYTNDCVCMPLLTSVVYIIFTHYITLHYITLHYIALHCITLDLLPAGWWYWQEAKILGRENNWRRRRVLEALVIQQRTPMMDLFAGLTLDPSWTPFVHPGKKQSRDWKCYIRRSNLYLGRTSFRSTSTCWWWPPGLRQTAFLNAPESERITPRSSGFNEVRNSYSITLHYYGFLQLALYTQMQICTHTNASLGEKHYASKANVTWENRQTNSSCYSSSGPCCSSLGQGPLQWVPWHAQGVHWDQNVHTGSHLTRRISMVSITTLHSFPYLDNEMHQTHTVWICILHG